MNRYAIVALAVAITLPLAACKPEAQQAPAQRDVQAQQARDAANQIRFNANAEIDNIRRRLELTSDPNLLGYIVLFNDAGQPILYEGVRGKVTSGSKRLTDPQVVRQVPTYGNNGGQHSVVLNAPSDEGTHGSSNPYIFYWNTDGTYRQWSGQYLYSTQPIRLRVEPVVVNILPPGQSN